MSLSASHSFFFFLCIIFLFILLVFISVCYFVFLSLSLFFFSLSLSLFVSLWVSQSLFPGYFAKSHVKTSHAVDLVCQMKCNITWYGLGHSKAHGNLKPNTLTREQANPPLGVKLACAGEGNMFWDLLLDMEGWARERERDIYIYVVELKLVQCLPFLVLKLVHVFVFFCFICFWKSRSPCRKKRIKK